MAFIDTVDPATADGDARALYDHYEAELGMIPNYALAFSPRPPVMRGWWALLGSITANMDKRRYELVTLAAARALSSSYCSLAHGKVLRDRFYDPGQVTAIAHDYHAANLSPAEVAMMAFAEQVVRDATAITQADVDALRAHGFSDAEVFDITTAAAARCFFSKTLDALGIAPDASYGALEPDLRDALTVGRPIAAP